MVKISDILQGAESVLSHMVSLDRRCWPRPWLVVCGGVQILSVGHSCVGGVWWPLSSNSDDSFSSNPHRHLHFEPGLNPDALNLTLILTRVLTPTLPLRINLDPLGSNRNGQFGTTRAIAV